MPLYFKEGTMKHKGIISFVCVILLLSMIVAGCGKNEGVGSPGHAPIVNPGIISGRILDETHIGLGDAKVNLYLNTGTQASNPIISVTTNGSGEFSISDLTPDSYILKVTKEGRNSFIIGITLSGDSPARFLEIISRVGNSVISFESTTPVKLENPTADGSSVILKWSKTSNPNFKSYEIYRSSNPDVTISSEHRGTINNPDVTTFQDADREKGENQYYRICEKIYDDDNIYSGSNVVITSINPTPSPTNSPSVVSFSPTGSNVPVNTPIQIVFSGEINHTTVESSFSLSSNVAGDSVSGTKSWNGNTFIFTPTHNLGYSRTMTATYHEPSTVPVHQIQDFSWQFNTVAAGTVTTSPTGSGVALNSPIQITFPVAMDGASVTNGFSINPAVAGTSSWDSAQNKLTFTPSSSLATSTTYQISVSGANDDAGNSYPDPISWSFSTRTDITNYTPVTTTTAVNTTIEITFSGPMNQSTVESGLEVAYDGSGGSVSGTCSWQGNKVIFTPAKHLAYSKTLNVVLTGAEDATGYTLPTFNWSFGTVAPGSPITVPTGTGISLTPSIEATFAVPVDGTSVVDGFSINPTVNGTKSFSAVDNKLTFIPSTPLLPSQNYTVTISGIKDDVGNDYPSPVSWNFTTRDPYGLGFFGEIQYKANADPTFIINVDVSGDGKNDLISSNYSSSNLSVWINKGNGSFMEAVNYETGYNPGNIAAADFNKDGKVDLVTANYASDNVSLLLGNGNGTFQTHTDIASGFNSICLAVGDFNSDSNMDIATANAGESNVSILLGNGDGTFQAPVKYTTNTSPQNIVAADFNRDSILDLFTTSPDHDRASVLIGNGDGTFQNFTSITTGPEPRYPAIGDINGDNNPDVVIPNEFDYTATVLIGNGDGTFHAPTFPTMEDGSVFYTLTDINGDNILDLFAVDAIASSVNEYYGNGDGTFTYHKTFFMGYNPHSVTLGDFDGDTKKDIASAATYTYGMCTMLGNGDGTFQETPYHTVSYNPYSVILADFNADGRTDAALTNYNTNVIDVLLGTGTGSFGPSTTYDIGWVSSCIAKGDFNGDGKIDLVTSNYDTNNASILLGNGDGTFQTSVEYPAGTTATWVAVGDYNRDSIQDLAVTNGGSNNVSILLGNGNGTFQAAVNYTAGTFPQHVLTADYNGDNNLDLIISNRDSNNISYLRGNGDGTFQTAVNYTAGTAPCYTASEDINLDGKLDLVIPNTDSDNLTIYLGNGDGTFGNRTDLATDYAPMFVVIYDIDGDGKKDVLLSNTNSANMAIMPGNGDGTFKTPYTYYMSGNIPGSNVLGLAVGFLNSDNLPDIVITNGSGNTFGVLLHK
jgi:hypothetical protein